MEIEEIREIVKEIDASIKAGMPLCCNFRVDAIFDLMVKELPECNEYLVEPSLVIHKMYSELFYTTYIAKRIADLDATFIILCGPREPGKLHSFFLEAEPGGLSFKTISELIKKLQDHASLSDEDQAAGKLIAELQQGASSAFQNEVKTLCELSISFDNFDLMFPLFYIFCGERISGHAHAEYTVEMAAEKLKKGNE